MKYISDVLKYLKITPAVLEYHGWAKFDPGSRIGVILKSGYMYFGDNHVYANVGDEIELAD